MSSWPSLAAAAGEPAPRLFQQTTRLFGAAAPAVRLWHDAAAWHPFANQVWFFLQYRSTAEFTGHFTIQPLPPAKGKAIWCARDLGVAQGFRTL